MTALSIRHLLECIAKQALAPTEQTGQHVAQVISEHSLVCLPRLGMGEPVGCSHCTAKF